MLEDEIIHASREPRIMTSAELMETDFSGDVMLHNTMRFDVQLAYIQPMLGDGEVDKDLLIASIRKAIIDAVDCVVGAGLDGTPIPGGALIVQVPRSAMLHRETIHFDLS